MRLFEAGAQHGVTIRLPNANDLLEEFGRNAALMQAGAA